VPDDEEAVRVMLRAYLLDRTMSELGRRLRDGGAGLDIPLSGILFLLREQVPKAALPRATPATGAGK